MTTAILIYDRDHGTANKGWYLRVNRDGQDEDIILDAETEAAALIECRSYVDETVEIEVHR